MNRLSECQTIPASLEEWLRGLRSGLEQHGWPKEIEDYQREGEEPGAEPGAPESLAGGFECDNVKVSVVV